jgi:GNAT superfamily N-acetyltransferase
MGSMVCVQSLDPIEARRHIGALADVLVDCVEGGASVSFMAPFTKPEAERFFRKVIDGLETGDRILLAAFRDEELVGTVQLLTAMPPNQPHRAEVSKLLVSRSARGHGIGTALMEAVEQQAKAIGKTLLLLDTATGGDAERLYQRLNWTRAAVIPDYAMLPDGKWCATTIFWKVLK